MFIFVLYKNMNVCILFLFFVFIVYNIVMDYYIYKVCFECYFVVVVGFFNCCDIMYYNFLWFL